MAIDGSGSAGQVAYWVDSDTLGGSDDHFWDTANKWLGVGTTSPNCPLHVIRSGTASSVSTADVAVFERDYEDTDDAYVRIIAGSEGKATLQFGYPASVGLQSIACDNPNDEMNIRAGKVGIGISSPNHPNEKLEVAGKIRANTAFNVNGADGITQIVAITDGAGTHTLTFTGGILTRYRLT